MKQIFKSELNTTDNGESAERLYAFQIEGDDEFWEFEDMTHQERCEKFGVFDEGGYDVAPGAKYYTYSFDWSTSHVIMYEKVAFNV